jgi:hypothetical protein
MEKVRQAFERKTLHEEKVKETDVLK